MREEYKCKKTWMFWCIWEGYKLSDVEFNSEGLDELDNISYSEYRKRIIKTKQKDET